MAFEREVVETLQHAARFIRGLNPDDHHTLYDYLRATMQKIAPVDSFYVGLFRSGKRIAYPYLYDGEEIEAAGVDTYGPHGVAAWVLSHKKSYTYAQDEGRLLNRGVRYGDTGRLSRDAVTAPLIDRGGNLPRVIGLAAMQSYRPKVYDADTVRAFEWLCGIVVALLRRGYEDTLSMRELASGDPQLDAVGPSFTDLVVEMTERLETIQAAVTDIQGALAEGRDVTGELGDLAGLVTRARKETFAMLTRPEEEALDAWSLLTAREREIADLVNRRLGNRRIAETLHISLATVKTHVYNIMKKLGVTQRSQITARLLPLGYDLD